MTRESRSPARVWPVTLAHPPVAVRPLRTSDARAWTEVTSRNRDWLAPWEATSPEGTPPASFPVVTRRLRREARAGRALPFAVEVDGRFRGQVSVSNIVGGVARMGSIGYWIDRAVAGRGIIPLSVALVVDHCFTAVGLHRIEINIRPENAASLAVARKLGMREEGLRQRFLHIDNEWRDHVSFAVVAEEVPEGMVARLTARTIPSSVGPPTTDLPSAPAGAAPLADDVSQPRPLVR